MLKTGTGRDHPEGGRNAPAFSWRSAGIWKWKHAFSGYEGSSDSAVVEYLNQNGMTYRPAGGKQCDGSGGRSDLPGSWRGWCETGW